MHDWDDDITTNPLLDAALALAEMGYPVFPLQPGTKVPLAGSHGCHDATTDAGEIRAAWTREPCGNIGLATAGLLVLDLDPPAGLAWPAALTPAQQQDLLAAPASQTPRGGLHLMFRQPPDRAWTIGAKRIAPDVDHRGNGGYILAPPSLIDGVAYAWDPDHLLEHRDALPEAPPWLAARLDEIHGGRIPLLEELADLPDGEVASDAVGHVATAARGAEPTDGNPIPPGQRNSTLARMAGMLRRIGSTEPEIHSYIAAVNIARCTPPLGAAEVAKIARSIARYEPDQIATLQIEGVADEMFGSNAPTPTPDATPAAENPDDDYAPPLPAPEALPAHLLEVPGFMGEVMRWNLATAHKPQPALALAGAIVLQAVLCARKLMDRRGNRTNLYLVGTARSGAGKDHSLQVNDRLLTEAGVDHLLGAGGFASDAGLANLVNEHPGVLFQIDEIGRFLRSIGDERNTHQFQIPTVLMQLWTAAGGVWRSKAYADTSRNFRVIEPCVSLLGMSVPEHFYLAFTPQALADGFIPRLLVFEGDAMPLRQVGGATSPPSDLVGIARWWGAFKPGGNLSTQFPHPRLVEADEPALVRFDALAELVDRESAQKADPGAVELWARAEEKALRLALIYAASEDHEDPRIREPAAAWACELVEHRTRRMIALAYEWVASTEFDKLQKRVLRIIRAAGGSVTQSHLTRRLQDLHRNQRADVLANLVDSGLLRSDPVTHGAGTTGGRPGRRYVLVTPASPNVAAAPALAPTGSTLAGS